VQIRSKPITLGFVFFVLAGQMVTAQPKVTSLKFRQELNIYEWLYLLRYTKQLDNKVIFAVREDFRSTLQSIPTSDLWKDNQNLRIDLSYPISDRLVASTQFFSHILKDQFSGFDNDVNFHAGSATLQYRPRPQVTLASTVSSKWQTQFQQSDQGFGYGMRADVSDFGFYGYSNDITVVGEQDVFPERKNQDINIRYKIERQFYESTADTVLLIFDRLRRDSFASDGEGIFVRNLVQTNKGVENRLSYRLASGASLFARNAIVATSFKVKNLKETESEVSKDDTGFESRHSIAIRLQSQEWFSHVGWSYRFRTRDDNRPQDTKPDPFGRFPTVGFDTEDVLVSLNLSSGLGLGAADSVGFYASVSRFKYDTSDTTNPNDHDQIKWLFTAGHSHRFSPELSLVWHTSVFLNHFVYIAGKFSSGNNWERNIQLSPEIIYRPAGRFSFRQKFTVRAKYRTFDFDDPETSNRNIVNRQFIATNVSTYSLSGRDRIEFGFNLELAEQGRFLYDRWQQNLALSWRNSEFGLRYVRYIGPDWKIVSGGNFFRQIRWEHKPNSEGKIEKREMNKHTNYGPVLEIAFRPQPSLELNFLGRVQFSSSSQRGNEHLNNFDVSLNWFF